MNHTLFALEARLPDCLADGSSGAQAASYATKFALCKLYDGLIFIAKTTRARPLPQ